MKFLKILRYFFNSFLSLSLSTQSTQWGEGGKGYSELAPPTVGSTTRSDVHVLVHVYVYLVLCMCFINFNLRKMKDVYKILRI